MAVAAAPAAVLGTGRRTMGTGPSTWLRGCKLGHETWHYEQSAKRTVTGPSSGSTKNRIDRRHAWGYRSSDVCGVLRERSTFVDACDWIGFFQRPQHPNKSRAQTTEGSGGTRGADVSVIRRGIAQTDRSTVFYGIRWGDRRDHPDIGIGSRWVSWTRWKNHPLQVKGRCSRRCYQISKRCW